MIWIITQVSLSVSLNFMITRLHKTLYTLYINAYRTVYLDVRLLVVIKTPSGVTIPFEVLSCDNVLSLKCMITIETDIPVADQNLLSDDTVLEDAKSVGAYIEGGKVTLHCTLVVSSKVL